MGGGTVLIDQAMKGVRPYGGVRDGSAGSLPASRLVAIEEAVLVAIDTDADT